ncbi:DUF481 domain-containing protein [Neorhodopirellula pilleata]|uniref:Mucin-like protein n=1 Tax=Neorhodopirellula pilleata TaxID=2714738 RepID=A0A5C5ZFL0_9BACT|nr:DUF481 domain-containing protein [Neorhodopirellula pilleata]TWT86112.1 hypothetical protein Pla100_61830 [Neorhodopirellula pilleata]
MFYQYLFSLFTRSGRLTLLGGGLLALFTFVITGPAHGQDWKSGQSNWNGNSYETLPPPKAPTSAAAAVPQPTPQSTPLQLNEPIDQWGREFGLSDAALESPVVAPGGAERAAVNAPLPLTDGPGTAPAIGSGMQSLPMGNAISEGQTFDAPPLQEDVVRWYEIPWRWVTDGWDNHAEFGLDGSSGNADTLAIQTGLEMKRKTDRYTLSLDIDYRQASANNQTTEDNGRLNLDYDRMFKESPWSAFGKFGMEFDEFKAFDLRLNFNGGLGYYWIRNDTTNFVSRFGAGASKEIGSPDDDWIPEAVFGLEADHQISSRQKIKAKVDYFPAWNDFANYRIVTDLAWETLLDSSDNLSLRLSVTDRYDSTPQGAEPNDFYYSALLLYKF